MKTKFETIGKVLGRNEMKKIKGGALPVKCSVNGFQCEGNQCCSNGVCVVLTPTTLCDF